MASVGGWIEFGDGGGRGFVLLVYYGGDKLRCFPRKLDLVGWLLSLFLIYTSLWRTTTDIEVYARISMDAKVWMEFVM